ncbi:MAG: hypothetical protein ACLFQK_05055, partial [Fibrobacterota bacterium]
MLLPKYAKRKPRKKQNAIPASFKIRIVCSESIIHPFLMTVPDKKIFMNQKSGTSSVFRLKSFVVVCLQSKMDHLINLVLLQRELDNQLILKVCI